MGIRRSSAAFLVAVACVVSLLGTDPPARAAQAGTVSASADDPVGVSVAFSQLAAPDGSAGVKIGRADLFPDAMAGAQLEPSWPLLLTPTGALDTRTSEEIVRLGATRAVILGGTAAIGPEVEDELLEMGLAVDRHAGTSRTHTAVLLAEQGMASRHLLLRADSFADSLAAGGLAAIDGSWGMLLSDPATLSPDTRRFLESGRATEIVIVGGTAAISQDVEDEVAALVPVVRRVAGPTRGFTATALADLVADPTGAILLDGRGSGAWAAGFTAAPYARTTRQPIVLTEGDVLPRETADWLGTQAFTDIVCGPSVPSTTCGTAREAVGSHVGLQPPTGPFPLERGGQAVSGRGLDGSFYFYVEDEVPTDQGDVHHLSIYRIGSDGRIDRGFGDNGYLYLYGYAAEPAPPPPPPPFGDVRFAPGSFVPGPDGFMYGLGSAWYPDRTEWGIIKFSASGEIVRTFGNDGLFSVRPPGTVAFAVQDVVFLDDGDLIVTGDACHPDVEAGTCGARGYYFATARITNDGQMVTDWGTGGFAVTDPNLDPTRYFRAMSKLIDLELSDSGILAGGRAMNCCRPTHGVLALLDPETGTWDESFGDSGFERFYVNVPEGPTRPPPGEGRNQYATSVTRVMDRGSNPAQVVLEGGNNDDSFVAVATNVDGVWSDARVETVTRSAQYGFLSNTIVPGPYPAVAVHTVYPRELLSFGNAGLSVIPVEGIGVSLGDGVGLALFSFGGGVQSGGPLAGERYDYLF